MQGVNPSTWLLRSLIVLLIAAAGFVILKKHVSCTRNGEMRVSSDVIAYVSAADNMLHGRNIYVHPDGSSTSFVYPAFLAFVFIPLTFINPLAVDVGWYVLNIVLIGLIIRQAYILFKMKTFSSLDRKGQWSLISLSLLFSSRYLIRNAQDANVNIVMLAMIVTSALLLKTSGQSIWASLIGVAGAVKILPLIFTIYFVTMRQWKAAGYLMLGFLVASLLPMTMLGVTAWWKYIETFLRYAQAQFSAQGLEIENFSLWGLLGRLLSHSKSFDASDGTVVYINVADLSLAQVRVAVYCINAALAAALHLIVNRREMKRQGEVGISNGGLVVTLLTMNLVSILTEDHHTVVFLVAYLFLLIVLREGVVTSKWFIWSVSGSGLLSLLLSHDVVVPVLGRYAYNIMLSYSLPILPVGIVLFLLVVYSMSRLSSHEAVEGVTPTR